MQVGSLTLLRPRGQATCVPSNHRIDLDLPSQPHAADRTQHRPCVCVCAFAGCDLASLVEAIVLSGRAIGWQEQAQAAEATGPVLFKRGSDDLQPSGHRPMHMVLPAC